MSDKDPLSSPNGCEGKYRRTGSPSSNAAHVSANMNLGPVAALVNCSVAAAANNSKSPAKTPKRDSPATIAAKGELKRISELRRTFEGMHRLQSK
jgi:hypothetical protein